MSRMIFVFTIVVNSICVVSLPLCFAQTLLADSIDEFSGTQGKNGWFYGYYNQSQDADALYQITDFQQLPLYLLENIWEGEIWELELGTGPPWTALGNEWGHPNGPPHGEIHWTVRRWVNKYNGKVQITGESGKMWFGMNGGDGTEIAILVDGLEIFSRVIQANDDKRIPFSLSTTLTTNSLVDFIIRPQNTDDFDSTAFYVQINKISSQPPQITHTPITSAIQGKEIWFSMDVVDDQDQLKTLAIYARITGERDFTSYPFVVSQGQTKYEMGISGLTQALDGVEYYIEATDEQGLTSTHGSAESPHHVCVTNPNKKNPVIIIPGIMGSELVDSKTGDLAWFNDDLLPNEPPFNNDTWLLELLLNEDGKTPDVRDRCALDLSYCDVNKCLYGGSSACVPGGKIISPKNLLDFIGYRAYGKLIEFLTKRLSEGGGGYTLKEDLYQFPYDWRLDLHGDFDNNNPNGLIHLLRNKILELAKTPCEQVNIIAHSQGGLLAKAYIQEYKDDHRINSIIFLGPPHLGSPFIYAVLEGYRALIRWLGERQVDLSDLLEPNTQTFVSQNFPAVYELLPQFNFISRQGKFEPYAVSFGSLSNQKLVALANNFHAFLDDSYPTGIRYYSIIGTGQLTLSGFIVKEDGCIGPYLDLYGDGKVTLFSSTSFGLAQRYFIEEEHSKLPGTEAVQKKILAILQNQPDTFVPGIGDKPIKGKGRLFSKCSPITISITDQIGNITGYSSKDIIREQISESAFFTFEHNEAGYIPYNDEYIVEIRGTDVGTFTLTFETQEDNDLIIESFGYNDIPVASESRGTIILLPDETPELLYDVNGDDKTDFVLAPNSETPDELKNMFSQRGDVNKDQRFDISDAISILSFLFLGNTISCPQAGDANSDGKFDISDSIYILNYLFLGTEVKPQGIIFCPKTE